MKKIILLLFCLLYFVHFKITAQNNAVESARVAYISQKIVLSTAQAEKFWPVYNELNSQRTDLRKAIRSEHAKMALPAEQTNEKMKYHLDQLFLLKQKENAIEKEFYSRFLTLISPKQLADLFMAEKEFQKILLKKVAED